MEDPKYSCKTCSYKKPLGKHGFCFKHDKVLKSLSFHCRDYKLKIDDEMKKKWDLDRENIIRRENELELEEYPVQSQNLFLIIIGGGFIFSIIVLWRMGVI
jgi:hypothetical protein